MTAAAVAVAAVAVAVAVAVAAVYNPTFSSRGGPSRVKVPHLAELAGARGGNDVIPGAEPGPVQAEPRVLVAQVAPLWEHGGGGGQYTVTSHRSKYKTRVIPLVPGDITIERQHRVQPVTNHHLDSRSK